MKELKCDGCNAHLGWLNDCGPRGWVYCDDCKKQEDEEREGEE